jgi:hypothetical protein
MALVLIGAFLGFIYIARTILSARSENRSPSSIDSLIVLAMVGVLAAAVVFDNQMVNERDTVELAIAALGLVFGLFSLMTLVLGRQSENSDDARGFLGIGIGLIIMGVAFGVPLLNSFAPSPTEVAFVLPTAINDAPSSSAGGLSNQRLVSSGGGSIDVAPTQTPVSLNSTIPQPVAPDIYFFTPTPTPQGLSCNGMVTIDLNVRTYPSVANNNIVTVAPTNKAVMITGRNEAASWWYISFDIYEGWVDADFVDAEESCNTIPPRSWS